LQFVLTGAEKLPARTAEAFRERFGIEVYEGYGTTECAPVVSVNVGDHRARGMHQVGAKRGSVGHPLPGVVVGIVDPDTGEALDSGKPGLIRVRGPNVMVGYLNQPERTAEVLKDGWYSTGDIGYLDEDGFIFITDRLSRFSKLGGEMVPHVKIEEELHRAVGAEEQVFAVTAAPDEAKGEQLVVLHTLEEARLDGLSEKLAAAGLPNLWIPRRAMFFKIESIPALGTGKLDLKRVKETAARLAAGGGASEGEKAEEAS
jgi:acyl-[acyl-carrier-protein]-phospholipid O-acyltransferase/long-chain-fatty-acid--[acyl-carrier-protein] ligase